MKVEKAFKRYVEAMCINCVNKNCENGKGIHICVYKDKVYAKCTDYIRKKNELEKYSKSQDINKNYLEITI